jgi:hypothetical protein
MKTKVLSFSALLAGLLGSAVLPALTAKEETTSTYRTEVNFLEPERFTDVRERNYDSESDRDRILGELKTHLQKQAQAYVPEGGKLSVKITDVDLAGEFEPWRGPAAQDVRIVKDIYAPRINLSYRLTDANGEVIKQGERVLTNMSFLLTASPTSVSDPLRHEKALIDDWLRSEFGQVKKSDGRAGS